MAVTKQFVSFAAGIFSVSKDRTNYSMYVVDNANIRNSDTAGMFSFGFTQEDLQQIRKILEDSLKNNPTNIQPTPLFYCNTSRAVFVNFANQVTSSSAQCGVGTIASFNVIKFIPTAALTDDLYPVFSFTHESTQYTGYFTFSGYVNRNSFNDNFIRDVFISSTIISYKPPSDITAEAATYKIGIGTSSVFTTDKDIVKYIDTGSSATGIRLLFANVPNKQYLDAITQYTEANYTDIYDFRNYTVSMARPAIHRVLYNGIMAIPAEGVLYYNFYTRSAPPQDAAYSGSNTDTVPYDSTFSRIYRAFSSNLLHGTAQSNNVATNLKTNAVVGSFCTNFKFLNKDFVGDLEATSFYPITTFAFDAETPYELACDTKMSTANSMSMYFKGRESKVPCVKTDGRCGLIVSNYTNDVSQRVFSFIGESIHLVDNDNKPLYADSLTTHIVLAACADFMKFSSGTFLFTRPFYIRVYYTDNTYDQKIIRHISAAPMFNVLLVENGSKLKSVSISSFSISDFDASYIYPFTDGREAYIPVGTYLFENTSNKTIKKVMMYYEDFKQDRVFGKVFLVLQKQIT